MERITILLFQTGIKKTDKQIFKINCKVGKHGALVVSTVASQLEVSEFVSLFWTLFVELHVFSRFVQTFLCPLVTSTQSKNMHVRSDMHVGQTSADPWILGRSRHRWWKSVEKFGWQLFRYFRYFNYTLAVWPKPKEIRCKILD